MNEVVERLRTEAQLAINGNHPILARSFALAIAEIARLTQERDEAQRELVDLKAKMAGDQVRLNAARNQISGLAAQRDGLLAQVRVLRRVAYEQDHRG